MRNWFRRGDKENELTVDELVILGRLGEAETRLQERLKSHTFDRLARARLGDVLGMLERPAEAVEHYLVAADAYRDDGFFEKAAAVLMKAAKLAPENTAVKRRVDEVEGERRLSHMRSEALTGLREAAAARGATATLELEYLWKRIEGSTFPQRFPPVQVRRLFAHLELVKLEPGGALRHPGDVEQEVYLVGPGEVEAVVPGEREELNLANYSSGDVFGESTLISRKPWLATYRATKPSTVLRLSRSSFETLLHDNPDPRSLIDAIRAQDNDGLLADHLAHLRVRY